VIKKCNDEPKNLSADAVAHNGWQACAVRLMKHCLPKRLYKDMCLLDFCKMKMSIREATLNLQKPY
jgi:hypothetical protein